MKAGIAVRIALLGAGVVACNGCKCGKATVEVNQREISFLFPAAGAGVGPADDRNAAQAGIQVDVEVEAWRVANGQTLVLTNDRDVVGGVPRQISAVVTNERVRFPMYELPEGEVKLRVALPEVGRDEVCDHTLCDEIQISVRVSVCEYNNPRNGDVLETEQAEYIAAADPFDPFETDVVLDCRGGVEGDSVSLQINGGLPLEATMDAGGRVLFARVPLAEGPNQLSAVPQSEAGEGTPALATVTVSTGRCRARLDRGDGSIYLAKDDTDLDPSNGMQAALGLVTDCGADAIVSLYLQGPEDDALQEVVLAAQPAYDPVADGIRFRLEGVDLPESLAPAIFDVMLVGKVTEPGAPSGRYGVTLKTRYWVDSQPPALLAYTPTTGACIGPLQDLYGEQSDGIQIDAFGSTSGAEDGNEVWVRVDTELEPAPACSEDAECAAPRLCRSGVCRNVATVAADSFVVSELTVPVGAVTLEYQVLDTAGNAAVSTASLEVQGTVPAVAIAAPADGQALGLQDDLDTVAPGLQVMVRVSVADVPEGTVGQLLVSSQPAIAFVPPSGATGEATIPLTLDDGVHTLRVRVRDECGNDVESAPATIVVLAAAAQLRAVAYAADNTACALHADEGACNGDVACMWNATLPAGGCIAGFALREGLADSATIHAASVDLDVFTGPGSPGHDRLITIAAFPEALLDAGGRSCAGAREELASATAAAADDGVLLTGLRLLEGANCFLVESDDGINVLSTTVVVNGSHAVPAVAITAPTAGTLDAAVDDSDAVAPGFNYTVTVALSGGVNADGSHDADGRLELQVGSTTDVYNVLEQDAAAGSTSVTFADASLPAGQLRLVAVYTDIYGNSATSTPIDILIDTTAPQVVITQPHSGSSTKAAELALEVTHLGGAAPTECTFVVNDVPEATAVAWANVATPLAHALAGVADGPYTVRAECTDGGSTGTTQTISIVVDDIPPAAPTLANEPLDAPGRLVFDAASAWVNGLVPDNSSAQGLQHRVSVIVDTAGEDPRGWTVELTVTAPGLLPSVYTRSLAAGGGSVLVIFDLVDFGGTEGNITFSAVVMDAAGNVSTATAATLTIDTIAPLITQVRPDPAQTELTRDDDENLDPSYVDAEFSYRVTGGAAGSDLRLTLEPVPADRSAAEFPVTVPVAAGSLSFGTFAFDDGRYVARAETQDAAGNVGKLIYVFDVAGLDARINWAIPSVGGLLSSARDTNASLAGYQGSFAFNVVGFVPGTPVHLCSNVAPAGATQPCRWGSDGQLGGANAGALVGSGTVAGAVTGGSVSMTNVSLAEGVQLLHAEAREADQSPDTFSSFLQFDVDTVPPLVESLQLVQNVTSNDTADLLRLNSAEGTVASGKLRTTASVIVSGSVEGRRVQMFSSAPAANTLVGSGLLDGTGNAAFTISLLEGRQRLTVKVTDAANNVNDAATSPVLEVLVDFSPGTISLPAAEFAPRPYTSRHGSIDTAGTATRSDDTLGIAVSVSVTDGQSLAGASVTIRRYATVDGETPEETHTVTLVAGQVTVAFDIGLAAGLNYLQAELVDAAGNTVSSVREGYPADFYGPELTLVVWNGADEPQICAQASPCSADIEDPAANNNRAKLDPNGLDDYRQPPTYAGTDLLFKLAGCQNSDPSLEDCASTPVTVWLESRLAGSGASFKPVFASSYGQLGDVPADALTNPGAAPVSYLLKAPSYAFDAGLTREVQAATLDQNGNRSTSSSVFLVTEIDGVLVDVERLTAAGLPTGEILHDGQYWGRAANVITPPGFATSLRVSVTPVGTVTPTDVELDVEHMVAGNPVVVSTHADLLSGGQASFTGVELLNSPFPAELDPHSITVTVNCGAAACGQQIYNNIIADIDPPSYQFDRCQLCTLGVPLVNDALCDQCADPSVDVDAGANIAPPTSVVAVWNAAGDQDANPSNGFTMLGTIAPLVVRLRGIEDGQTVRLESDQQPLTGATAQSTGCEPVSNCKATFAQLGVPSLSANLMHAISVEMYDRAGNAAVPDVPRDPEIIYARTDVVAPEASPPTVCIGESTTPATVSQPESDQESYEALECATLCAETELCSRRHGEVTLSWIAPADDGASGGDVTGYEVSVAALGIPYADGGGPIRTYSSCSDLDADGPVEQRMSVAPSISAGGSEQTTVVGLYPHRAYCFSVQAVDDAGNSSPIAESATRRDLPLISYPEIVDFDPADPAWVDDAPAAAFYTDPSAGASTYYQFGSMVVNAGDLDGDGGDDFAVAGVNSSTSVASVHIFLSSSSGRSPMAPDISITESEISAGSANFGMVMAGGDFDGDGLSDLAIGAPGMTVAGGANPGDLAGAVFLYFGVAGQGLRQDANPGDPELPSINADVALLAPTMSLFGFVVAIGQVDGIAGNDLVVGAPFSRGGTVFGFSGGSRDRFPASPPTPAKVFLDLAAGAAPGFTNRADYAINHAARVGFFPAAMAVADLNGDGVDDLAISDHRLAHAAGRAAGSGQVYVYRGGAAMSGEIPTPEDPDGQLMHVLRYVEAPTSTNFGQTLAAVPAPRFDDTADWLLVQAAGGSAGQRVVIFKGTSQGSTPGVVPALYPVGGLPAVEYEELDRRSWDGSVASTFGWSLGNLGRLNEHGGTAICAGPGVAAPARRPTFIYSFNGDLDTLEKRSVFYGANARCVGLDGYLVGRDEPRLQLLLTSEAAASLYLYR